MSFINPYIFVDEIGVEPIGYLGGQPINFDMSSKHAVNLSNLLVGTFIGEVTNNSIHYTNASVNLERYIDESLGTSIFENGITEYLSGKREIFFENDSLHNMYSEVLEGTIIIAVIENIYNTHMNFSTQSMEGIIEDLTISSAITHNNTLSIQGVRENLTIINSINKVSIGASMFGIIEADIIDSIHNTYLFDPINASITLNSNRYLETPQENRYLETPIV